MWPYAQGGSAPRSKPLPFYTPFLIEIRYPFRIPSTENCTSFIYLWSDSYKTFHLRNPLKWLNMDESAGRSICSRYFESPLKYLNDSFILSPFLNFNLWNPYLFICLQPTRVNPFWAEPPSTVHHRKPSPPPQGFHQPPFGWSLPVQSIIGSVPPPCDFTSCKTAYHQGKFNKKLQVAYTHVHAFIWKEAGDSSVYYIYLTWPLARYKKQG